MKLYFDAYAGAEEIHVSCTRTHKFELLRVSFAFLTSTHLSLQCAKPVWAQCDQKQTVSESILSLRTSFFIPPPKLDSLPGIH